jgi:MFS family permease
MLAYVSSFIDRQTLFLLVGPIRRDLGISDWQMSLLMGLSFALFYSVLGLPIGRLADRVSRRGIIGIEISIWSVMTAACGLASTYGQLFLARVGVGVGEAALSPPAYSLLADYFPRERLGTAIGVYSLGIYLGSGLSLMLGGWLASAGSWRSVFLWIGLPGLGIALLMRTIAEPRRGAMSAGPPPGAVPVTAVWRYFLTHWRAYLGHHLGFGLIAMVNYSWAAWVPSFLVRLHGWTTARVGLIYGLWTATFGVAGVVLGGMLGDALRRRGHLDAKLRVGLVGVAGQVVAGLLFLFAPTDGMTWALIPSTFFASFGFGAAAAGVQEITPVPMRAQASALYLFFVSLIGLGAGPSFVAWFTDHVWHDDRAVGHAMVAVTLIGLTLAAATLASGLRGFREAAAGAERWQPERES